MNMVEGKVAIITGAARGLGYGIAALLGQHGAKVVITDLDSEGLAAAENTLRSEGVEVTSCVGNVAEVPAIEAMGGGSRESLRRHRHPGQQCRGQRPYAAKD